MQVETRRSASRSGASVVGLNTISVVTQPAPASRKLAFGQVQVQGLQVVSAMSSLEHLVPDPLHQETSSDKLVSIKRWARGGY